MSPTPREVLERLCTERRENLSALSRLIGRNETYIQQFLRKGSPRHLGEKERRALAGHFNISESLLGGPHEPDDLVPVSRSPVRASAGPGAFADDTAGRPWFAFDRQWLRTMTSSGPDRLSMIRVEGDSMSPTLNEGDDILVDLADSADRLRDGIYVLRTDDTLLVKRLSVHPVGRRLTIQSDNPAYGDLPDIAPDQVQLIGRVVWAGRRIV
jgi:phage repressor protein C with HTH and peptisase S24 domain